MGELMSNDVQSHEEVAERVAGEERRASVASCGSLARLGHGAHHRRIPGRPGQLLEPRRPVRVRFAPAHRRPRQRPHHHHRRQPHRHRPRRPLAREGSGQRRPSLRRRARSRRRARISCPSSSTRPADVRRRGSRRRPRSPSSPSSTPAFDPVAGRGLPRRIRGVAARGGARSRSALHDSATPSRSSRPIPTSPPSRRRSRARKPADEAADLEVSDASSAEAEPIAFEADAEIAFEPAVEFAFDEAGEPSFDDAALDPVDGGAGRRRDRGDRAGRRRGAGRLVDVRRHLHAAGRRRHGPVAESQFDVTAADGRRSMRRRRRSSTRIRPRAMASRRPSLPSRSRPKTA